MIAVIGHPLFAQHLQGYPHIERPERYDAVMKAANDQSLRGEVAHLEAVPVQREWLKLVHAPEYVARILSLDATTPQVLDWGDTVATEKTVAAAVHAAGAAVQAVQAVVAGDFSSAFCAVRPPGHHAESDHAMGFCIFNNIAIAAAYLIEIEGLQRVAVVDWDVHHGNGTEQAFAADRRVLYISLHQYPHYPGTGAAETVGVGDGRGFTLNIPMPGGSDDTDYLTAFDNQVLPALNEFRPEIILISAGFDAHRDDPLSDIRLTTSAFGAMTRRLKGVTTRHGAGRIVSLLEGGYNLTALHDSVLVHLQELAGSAPPTSDAS